MILHLDNKQNEIKHMKKNTTVNQNVQALTLKEAVIEAVNELKVNGSFSAHDVTSVVRDSVNAGEYILPALKAGPNAEGIKYWVNHPDVKDVLAALQNDGTLANLGLTDVDYSGPYRVFKFGTVANTAPVAAEPATDTVAAAVDTSADSDDEANVSPLAERITNYLTKVGSATLKQVQSALKVNGITCKDFADIVKNMGYTVTPGTPECYSTYTVTLS